MIREAEVKREEGRGREERRGEERRGRGSMRREAY